MKLHLVGGFLGSGKTTAIIQAARLLMAQGQRVGVITNDQGKYLVDTAFFRLADLPAVEVTGGCFCCNYDDLDSSLEQLIAEAAPDVIFAESVGSCADLVATVVKPLLTLKAVQATPTSFTVFTDGRMLRRRLMDEPLPFSEDVLYIYDQQIEEAGLVVINKADLIQSSALESTLSAFSARYPDKLVMAQASLQPQGVTAWVDRIQSGDGVLPSAVLDMDYRRYGKGEAELAWLDERVMLESEDDLTPRLIRLIGGFISAVQARGAGIGHIKFILKAGDVEKKISFTTLAEPDWEAQLPAGLVGPVELLVNARAALPAEDLRQLFAGACQTSGMVFSEQDVAYFHPGQPKPTHRML